MKGDETVRRTDRAFVFIATFPCDGEVKPVHDTARQAYIERTANEQLKQERYYAWRNLELGLYEVFQIYIDRLAFRREPSGKWSTPYCEFSLSHSDYIVASSIASVPIGIDIQRIREPRHPDFASRVLTPREYEKYLSLEDEEQLHYLFRMWTAKEAIFKMRGHAHFSPSTIEVEGECVHTEIILENGVDYAWSVAWDGSVPLAIFPVSKFV